MATSKSELGILVGVDGSAESDAAVSWAAQDAVMRGAPMTLLHVIVPVVVTWPVRHLQEGYRKYQEDHGRQAIERARETAGKAVGGRDLRIQSAVRHGGTVAELIAASREATMTVVGSRGLGAISAGLLGSVSRGLLHYSPRPVAVIHPGEPRPAAFPVLLGIDGSPASEKATALAFDEASRRGVDLIALHAWSDVGPLPDDRAQWSECDQESDEILAERLAGWQERYPDVQVRRRIVRDRPAHWLISESARAQLVVTGSRGHGGFDRLLLGSVSSAVAESSTCPVVVVPGGERR